MPSSTPSGREKEIFLQADEIENLEEREAFLLKECGADVDLLARVRSLLHSVEEHGDEDPFDPAHFAVLDEARKKASQELTEESPFMDGLGSKITYIGDYELIEEIGRGAMGVVFRANQTSLNRPVALKLILDEELASETNRQRFRVEAEAAANLNHPNIVPVYEVGRHEGHDYYSMLLVPGGTLTGRMREIGANPRRAVELTVKVVDAVQSAHERGIIHRDLKPDNILLDEHGEPLVSDFGLACRLEQAVNLTLTGQIMGTPQYMAPEQAEGDSGPVTTAADIHSLGAILYELLAGEPAFKSDSVLKILTLVKEDVPRRLSLLRSTIDRDLETIVAKCLEKDPNHRYRSAGLLRDDLQAWLEHRPIAARRPGRIERVRKWVRRRPVHAALLGTAALLVVALGVGGPLAAYQQSVLRQQADEATDLAQERAEANRRLLYYSNMNQAGQATSEPGMFPAMLHLLDKWRPQRTPGDETEADLRTRSAKHTGTATEAACSQ